MSIVYLLIPATILLGLIALVAYLWAVRTGQFDDLDTPPKRMMVDDEEHASRKDTQG